MWMSDVSQQYNLSAPKLKFCDVQNLPKEGLGNRSAALWSHLPWPHSLGETQTPHSGSSGKQQLPKRQLPSSFISLLAAGPRSLWHHWISWFKRPFPSHLGQASWCMGCGNEERRAGRSRKILKKYEVEFKICFWAALFCPWAVADYKARQL